MRLTTLTLPLLSLIPSILADFHIDTMYNSVVVGGTQQQHWTDYVACPSNYWNCDCMANGDRAGTVIDGHPGDSVFAIEGGFCGMGKMNFYQDGDSYKFYEDGGDGTQIGTCYWNNENRECIIPLGSSYANGGMVCYSYVCN